MNFGETIHLNIILGNLWIVSWERNQLKIIGQKRQMDVGRPRKTNAYHVTFPNMLNILITILFFLIKPLSTVRINGRFTVCETPDQTNIENTLILNTEKDCYASNATQKVFVESDKKFRRVDLLFKQILNIDGNE
ncbi:hypothetical protein BpHYR1_015501 [Brachionus plicatilis]|uniref:Uncharacterized protein n=1 Tax=Brachionus plicatilis TaxID=10195 RepID=A0A3M7RA79_BRAPC|nr:hypothetical protein BpHYR1_015501 [Brachionus plicatilis]